MNYIRSHIHSFECDFPGCPNCIEHGEHYKADAERLIKRDGWTIRNGKYFCSAHKPSVPADTAEEG